MRGCCDDFDETNCAGRVRCDSEFFYCLKSQLRLNIEDTLSFLPERDITTRADQLGCLETSTATPTALKSDVDTDGESLNFTVLGLPNPLEFRVTAFRLQV